ncbi:MAG: TRZ/ATZ family hydrolase, partial [Gammaproteobacteria bacterium]
MNARDSSTVIDTLIHAGAIIPVVPSGLVLKDHALAIHQGKIHSLLPSADARQQLSAT